MLRDESVCAARRPPQPSQMLVLSPPPPQTISIPYSNQAVARLRSPGTARLPSKLAIMEADMFRMESLPSCFRIRDPFVNSFGKNILAPRGIRFLYCEKIESIRRPKAVNSKIGLQIRL